MLNSKKILQAIEKQGEEIQMLSEQLQKMNDENQVLGSRLNDLQKKLESNLSDFGKEMLPIIQSGNYIVATTSDYNMVFDITGCSVNNFAKLQLWKKNYGMAQIFRITYVGKGLYTFTPACSEKVLDVNVEEEIVQQYEWINRPTQQWYIIDAEDGDYNIVSCYNNKCMDIIKDKVVGGTVISLTDKNDNISQKFRFYPINEYSILKQATNESVENGRNLLNKINTYNAHNEMRFWQLYNKDQENICLAKKRFFMNLPKGTGKIRILQMVEKELLQAFDTLCRKNNLKYWMFGGTLLGATRHKGFIPWDDDLDTAMLREDFVKLRKVVENDKEYRITVVYDSIAQSRQVRFRYKNLDNPVFVDIFIYDYCDNDRDDMWLKQKAIRNKLLDEINVAMLNMNECSKHYYLEGDAEFSQLQELFSKYQQEMIKLQGKKEGICWAIDNPTAKTKGEYKVQEIFPLVELEFEERLYYAPNSYQEILRGIYGDIYVLPEDLFTHFEHISMKELDDYIEKYEKNE